MNSFKNFEEGKIDFSAKVVPISSINWNTHPKFSGVYLKHLITGKDTEEKFSCHMVKVEPGCEIGEHSHEGKIELHEVIGGEGTCLLGKKKIIYQEGTIALIPSSLKHKVIAGKRGIYLLAKFIPALI